MSNELNETETVSDEQLAYRVQTGCGNSLSLLCERLWPRLVHVLERRLPQRADAEDIAQLTLVRAIEQIDRYDPKYRFSPWVFTIALRLASDQLRRSGRRAETLFKDQPDYSAPPDQQAIDCETRDRLWTIAERVLSPDQWTALWLFYGEGHTAAQVAHTMGKATFSVRALLYRARKSLQPHLEAQGDSVREDLADASWSERRRRAYLILARTQT